MPLKIKVCGISRTPPQFRDVSPFSRFADFTRLRFNNGEKKERKKEVMGIDIIPLLNNNNLCTRIKRFFFYFIYNQIRSSFHSSKKKKRKTYIRTDIRDYFRNQVTVRETLKLILGEDGLMHSVREYRMAARNIRG